MSLRNHRRHSVQRYALDLTTGSSSWWVTSYADEADDLSLVTAFNASGYDLLKQFVAAPGNIVFSPYSIGSAMAMMLSGAKGDMAIEMASAPHQELDRSRMDAATLLF